MSCWDSWPFVYVVVFAPCNISFVGYLCIAHRGNHSIQHQLNFPDTLQSLVGQQNARHGIIKIFNALQETRANKHLLYVSRFKPPRGFIAFWILGFFWHTEVDFSPLYSESLLFNVSVPFSQYHFYLFIWLRKIKEPPADVTYSWSHMSVSWVLRSHLYITA